MAAILFTDVVGYSRFDENDQKMVAEELNKWCRKRLKEPLAYRDAHRTKETPVAAMPTGDGVVICLRVIPGCIPNPGLFLLELAFDLQDWGRSMENKLTSGTVHLRIGLHAGEHGSIKDVNLQNNFCGYDINMAQRIMDCGEANHILCSPTAKGKFFSNLPRKWPGAKVTSVESVHKIKHGEDIVLCNITKTEKGQTYGNPEPPRAYWKCRILPFAQTGFRDFHSCKQLAVVGVTNDQIASALDRALRDAKSPRRLNELKDLKQLDLFYASAKVLASMPNEDKQIVPAGGVGGNADRSLPVLKAERLHSIATIMKLNEFGIDAKCYEYEFPPVAGSVAGDFEDEESGVIKVTHYVWGRNAGSCPTIILRVNELRPVYNVYVDYIRLLREKSKELTNGE